MDNIGYADAIVERRLPCEPVTLKPATQKAVAVANEELRRKKDEEHSEDEDLRAS